MKKLFSVLLILAACGVLYSAGIVPDYHDYQISFPGTPAAFYGSAYGFANPASLAMLRKPDLSFTWDDKNGRIFESGHWLMSVAVPYLGFGINRTTIGSFQVDDYKISLGMGRKAFGLGFGYGWSTGDTAFFNRAGILTLGALCRPDLYISFGLTGNFGVDSESSEGIFDLAVRPLGKKNWTVFGDVSLRNGQTFDNSVWSLGTSVIPFDGLNVSLGYSSRNQLSCAFRIGFGGMTYAVQPKFNVITGGSSSTYSVEIGGNPENILSPAQKKSRYVSLVLDGRIEYRKSSLFDRSWTLKSLLAAIQAAAEDGSVAGLVINISGMEIPGEMKWEITEKLKAFRKTGKKVIIYFDNADLSTFAFISASADKLFMDPMGLVNLMGISASRMYFKRSLEKLGVGFQEWRYFKFKSAMEMLSRTNMSEADREQTKAFLDRVYAMMREEITEARKLEPGQLEKLIDDTVMLSAAEARQKKLIDGICHWEGIQETMKDVMHEGKQILPPRVIADRSVLADTWGEPPTVAVIYGLGICDMDTGIAARKLVNDINNAAKNPAVKAVVFRVDSPGGSALASDIVADAVRKCNLKKPVIISQGAVAASGGYWLSMYGGRIVSSPYTLTGSIGVIGGWLYNSGFRQKLGITTDSVKTGEHSDLESGLPVPFLGVLPDRGLDEKEIGIMGHQIRQMYTNFVEKVADARKKGFDDIDAVGQGRIWSGIDAMSIGLVDEMGNLDTAISLAKKQAKIPEGREIRTPEFPREDFWGFADDFRHRGWTSVRDNDFVKNMKFRLEQNGNCLVIVPYELAPVK